MTPSDELGSVEYNYVRSRQLEGTYPGAPDTGAWVVTSMRVHKGWGSPLEEAWPYDGHKWPPAPEPPEIDEIAKARRMFAYGRVRNLTEFRQLLASNKSIVAAFEIDDSWEACKSGRIEDPQSHQPRGAHTIHIFGYDDTDAQLHFANSWGVNWGDSGFGYLPYAYVDQRMLEAWYQDLGRPASESSWQANTGSIMTVIGVLNALGRILHVVEQVDLTADEIMGWALAVEIDEALHVDELFVRPAYRGRGLGRRLAREVGSIAARQHRPIILWISHADLTGAATPAQTAILDSLGLTSFPCSKRWASRIAIRTASQARLAAQF